MMMSFGDIAVLVTVGLLVLVIWSMLRPAEVVEPDNHMLEDVD